MIEVGAAKKRSQSQMVVRGLDSSLFSLFSHSILLAEEEEEKEKEELRAERKRRKT